MKLNAEKFDYISETERLVIRPLQKDDYENWLNEFENRLSSQHRHDKGKMDMSECTLDWFHDLVDRHQELARTDAVYVFGVSPYQSGQYRFCKIS